MARMAQIAASATAVVPNGANPVAGYAALVRHRRRHGAVGRHDLHRFPAIEVLALVELADLIGMAFLARHGRDHARVTRVRTSVLCAVAIGTAHKCRFAAQAKVFGRSDVAARTGLLFCRHGGRGLGPVRFDDRPPCRDNLDHSDQQGDKHKGERRLGNLMPVHHRLLH